jgi:hypothetical protein
MSTCRPLREEFHALLGDAEVTRDHLDVSVQLLGQRVERIHATRNEGDAVPAPRQLASEVGADARGSTRDERRSLRRRRRQTHEILLNTDAFRVADSYDLPRLRSASTLARLPVPR